MMKRIIIKYLMSFVYPDSLICVYLIYVVYLMKIIKLQTKIKCTYTVTGRGHVRFCRGHEINDILMFMNLIHIQPFVTIATWDYKK